MKRIIFLVFLCSCGTPGGKPVVGPDKQFAGQLEGAITGAGAGAITGFQLGAATGPAAVVGAGLGAVAGGIQGAALDGAEDGSRKLQNSLKQERDKSTVHAVLQDHYKRRLALFPSRDIYPADLFFFGDGSKICPSGVPLVRELASLNRNRMPWSRFAVVAYVKSNDLESSYAHHLAEVRAREIGNYFVRSGIEPRRIVAKAVVMKAPLIIDPDDHPGRYNQAIELIPLDR